MNFLFVILDALRYDTFVKGKTPNIDSLGKAQKVYSPGCWTLPSIFSLLVIPAHIGSDHFLPHFAPFWVPGILKKLGYNNYFLNSNGWLIPFKHIFAKDFDEFRDFPKSPAFCLKEMVDTALKKIEKTPFFIMILACETHKPYYNGSQIKALEYCDEQLGRLFNVLREKKSDTRVIVTADHGDSEQGHHEPSNLHVFSKEIFEIPLVVGKI